MILCMFWKEEREREKNEIMDLNFRLPFMIYVE